MIVIFTATCEGPEAAFLSRAGVRYQMLINPKNIAYMVPTEQVIAMNNGTFLKVSAIEFKRVTLLIAPELA